MPAWPASLPQPIAPDIELRPVDPVSRTDMEAGEPRSRRRFTRAPTRYSLRWEFDRHEMDIFEAWHKWEILDGAAWFDLLLPNGQGVTLYSARFTRMWQAKLRKNGIFDVSAEVEVRVRPVMSQAALAPYL